MAQNITLLGANYSAVPAVRLPKTGGGTADFTDVTDTTATASDVASGKYFYTSSGVRTQGTSSGGGGASNIVQGEFTTGSTGASTGTFTIPYTGSGYPIALTIVVKGGAYNNTSSGDTDWYNSVNRYDVGVFYMTKSRITSAPTYTSGADNQGVTAIIYKNSTSTATTYTRTSAMTSVVYNTSSTNASTSANCIRFKGNGKTVSYYIGNRTSSTVGLARDTTFQYIAVYSE